ncbi:hypothetical protein FHG87_007665 [Trinorchestia longiramus]|nr:hypothetical protein FHG87_007665 [Trinorchestia longiramus]
MHISNPTLLRMIIKRTHFSTIYKSTKTMQLYYIKTMPLIYPVILLHTLSPSAISNLQKVQNRALRYKTNTSWTDFATAKSLYESTNIPPINILLQEHAKKIWSNLLKINIQQYNSLTLPPELINKQHHRFRSFKLHALAPAPQPRCL